MLARVRRSRARAQAYRCRYNLYAAGYRVLFLLSAPQDRQGALLGVISTKFSRGVYCSQSAVICRAADLARGFPASHKQFQLQTRGIQATAVLTSALVGYPLVVGYPLEASKL